MDEDMVTQFIPERLPQSDAAMRAYIQEIATALRELQVKHNAAIERIVVLEGLHP